MNRNTLKILLSFAIGEITQIILHALCFNYWAQYQIPFCAAGGFLVLAAIYAGVWVANHSAETATPKSYLDWAKIPGDER